MLATHRSLGLVYKTFAFSACSFFCACGGDSDKKETPATVVYGSMTLSDSKTGTDAGTFSLTSAEKCTRNSDTGRVDISISQGAGKPSLTLAIKDYSATAKVYSCKQATDNRESTNDVGGKFESCMVDAKVLSTATATVLNGYSMYRETASTKPFTYGASCSIDVTKASPAIAGTILCADMIQTTLEGAARNPIDATVIADLKADFNCTFQ